MEIHRSVATFGHGTRWKFGFIALVYLDLLLTLFAVQHGYSELNPIMTRLLSRPEELLLVKGLAAPIIAWLVPAQLLLPSVGVLLALAGWNISELLVSP